MNTLLQHAHDSGRLTEADAEWEIPLAQLRTAQSKHGSNDRIKESIRRIRRVEVKIAYATPEGGNRFLESNLLNLTDTSEDDHPGATVQFGIPKRLRLILARSNRWGRIRCEIAYAMSSKYAIALYEMIALRANRDRCVEIIDITKFRELLGVPPGAYDRADNFARFVLSPAELEVNGLSDMNVRLELTRKHPRAPAHAATLSWLRKTDDEFRMASQRRGRSKSWVDRGGGGERDRLRRITRQYDFEPIR
jgi:hypothetical protein